MEVFRDYLGVMIGFIGFMSLLIILSEIDVSKKWTDIFKGDERDE